MVIAHFQHKYFLKVFHNIFHSIIYWANLMDHIMLIAKPHPIKIRKIGDIKITNHS